MIIPNNNVKKVKSSLTRSLPVENLLQQNVWSIINYLQATEVAQWGAPRCSWSQPATDNGVRDSRSNWLFHYPSLHSVVDPELHVLHGTNAFHKSLDLMQPVKSEHTTFGMPGQRTACATTLGMKLEYGWVTLLFIWTLLYGTELSTEQLTLFWMCSISIL